MGKKAFLASRTAFKDGWRKVEVGGFFFFLRRTKRLDEKRKEDNGRERDQKKRGDQYLACNYQWLPRLPGDGMQMRVRLRGRRF